MEAGSVGIPANSYDFSFAYDNATYSDRTLLLEIGDTDDNRSQLEPNTKRRRRDDPILTATKEPRVKTIHISSMILAAASSFFVKLFSNGMLESKHKNVKVRIDASEEEAFMDLLKYIYTNKLPTSLNGLLDLCVMADKFEVIPCLTACVKSLQTLPMTCESASLCLDLPQSLLMFPTTRQLIDAAKNFLLAKFKDFHKSKGEMLNLPLASIGVVLGSDELQVTSECVVYDFVVKWARKHYPNLEQRRGILKTHLLHLVRFPLMTPKKLAEEVQICSDIDPEVASKIVIDALRFKAETPHQKRRLAAKEGNTAASRQFVERAHTCLPVNVVELALPHRPCIVYLHFTKEKLKQSFPGGRIMSESFHLGDQEFVLFGDIVGNNFECFRLALIVLGSATVTVNYDIHYSRPRPRGYQMGSREEFKRLANGSHTFVGQGPGRTKYLHDSIKWTGRYGDHSPFFIDNVLHLRAKLSIKK